MEEKEEGIRGVRKGNDGGEEKRCKYTWRDRRVMAIAMAVASREDDNNEKKNHVTLNDSGGDCSVTRRRLI